MAIPAAVANDWPDDDSESKDGIRDSKNKDTGFIVDTVHLTAKESSLILTKRDLPVARL